MINRKLKLDPRDGTKNRKKRLRRDENWMWQPQEKTGGESSKILLVMVED